MAVRLSGILNVGSRMSVLGRVRSLHVYPVKSARGIALETATLDDFGLADDRRFMLCQSSDGRFLSQRELPALALVQPSLVGDHLIIAAPGRESLHVLRRPSGPRRPVQLWDWDAEASVVDLGADAAKWWSALVQRDVRFVWSPDDTTRLTQPTATGVAGGRVAFSDGFPLLLVSEASLDGLNARLPAPVPMDRFRPNVVLSEVATAHAEDGWARVRVGDVVLRGTKRCPRCVMTTIDQATATGRDEPLRTLATYRRDDGKIWFGVNAEHETHGTLRVGDAVREMGSA